MAGFWKQLKRLWIRTEIQAVETNGVLQQRADMQSELQSTSPTLLSPLGRAPEPFWEQTRQMDAANTQQTVDALRAQLDEEDASDSDTRAAAADHPTETTDGVTQHVDVDAKRP